MSDEAQNSVNSPLNTITKTNSPKAKKPRKPMTKKQKVSFTIDIFVIIAGSALMAFGMIAFFMPHYIVPGGFSGFAMILFRLYEHTAMRWLGPGIVVILMNIPLIIVSIKIRGRAFGVLSLIGTVAFSLFLELFILLNLDYHLSAITGNPILAVFYGSIIAGIGFGFLVRRGGSTGGSDMLSSLLNSINPKLSFGTILFIIDGLVVLLSGVVSTILASIAYGNFTLDLEPALLAILGIFVASFVADYVIVGKNRAMSFFIVCKDPKAMTKAIYARINRGVTSLKAKGMYSDKEREVLLCVVKRSQAIMLKRIVFETEEGAFVFSHNIGEVFGEGFMVPDKNRAQLNKALAPFTKIFNKGIKDCKNGLLGLELEHFVVDKKTNLSVSFFGKGGVEAILKELAPLYDQKIYSQNHLIALKREHLLVSLEPAGQLEVSIGEFYELDKIAEIYNRFLKEISPILNKFNLKLITEGYQPASKAESLDLLPKARYRLMDDHFKHSGDMGLYMMRGTAATHVAIDYFSEEDAMAKFRLANILSPLFVFLTDNCKVFEGEINNQKMLRHKIWQGVDEVRCGIVRGVNSFNDYAKFIYDTPPIFVLEGEDIKDTGKTSLAKIMHDGHLSTANAEHALSMVFPYVRLKNFLEIRTADSMDFNLALGYVALIKGIFYNQNALDILLKEFEAVVDADIYISFDALMADGLQASVYGMAASELFSKIFSLASEALVESERILLESLKGLLNNE